MKIAALLVVVVYMEYETADASITLVRFRTVQP